MAKNTLKQIRVWKVFVLSIITLGVYAIIWLVKRNNELPGDRPKFLHWGWLVGALLVMSMAIIALYIYCMAAISDASVAALTYVIVSNVLTLAGIVVVAVWVLRAALRLNGVLKLPLSNRTIILLGIFFAPTLIAIEQNVINMGAVAKKRQGELASKYHTAAWISITLGVLFFVAPLFVQPIDRDLENFERDHTEIRRIVGETVELSQQYIACEADLKEKYPDDQVIDDNADAYEAASGKCDEIYEKIQNIK